MITQVQVFFSLSLCALLLKGLVIDLSAVISEKISHLKDDYIAFLALYFIHTEYAFNYFY